MKVIFTTYALFFKGVFSLLFTKKNNKLNCAVETLLNQFTFRAPLKLNLFLFGLKIFKDGLKKIWLKSTKEFVKQYDSNSNLAIFNDSLNNSKLVKEDYLEEILNKKFNSVIIYNAVDFQGNIFEKLILTLLFIIGFLPLLVILSFLKKKKKAFFGYYELLETIAITKFLKKLNIKTVYTFSSYEKSSNFFTVIFNTQNISFVKICSPNPIKIHYKKVVADEFIFTAPFQNEEYIDLKKNWFVSKTNLWPVYDFKKYKLKYQSNNCIEDVNWKIGFYSSAFSRREELGNNILDDNYRKSEIKLLELLNQFLKENKKYSLIIYLHPLEKENQTIYNRSTEYYSAIFRETSSQINFYPKEKLTWQDFESINISISVTSTISFERLYCGFKSLYAPICFENGFFDNTKLENISIKGETNFSEFLKLNLEIPTKDFFEYHNIKEYVFY